MELLIDVNVAKSKITVGFKGLISSADENVLDTAYAVKSCNFAFENGVLTGGIGIDEGEGFYPAPIVDRHKYPVVPDGKEVLDVFLYRRKTADGKPDDRIVVRLINGAFLYTSVFKSDEWHEVPSLRILGNVSAVNYNYNGEDMLLLSSDRYCLYFITDSTAYACTNAPKFSSITVHNERVYGSVNGVNNQVWFSDDFNPSNWNVSANEAGFINFADECGEVLKVVSFLNYLYIFREFGIYRLTAYGDQSEFVLKKVFTDTERIVKDSIELCGDKIVFYAGDGLYAFDGYEVSRMATEIPSVKYTQSMSCAYLGDCYYMACNIWEAQKTNNAVIRYSFKDKSVSVLYGYDVKQLRPVRVHNGSQVLCLFNGDNNRIIGMMSKSGKVLGTPTPKKYFSPESAFSSTALKTVRSVSVRTDTPITVTVKLDGKRYDYDIGGSNLLQTVPVEHSGRVLGFEISSTSANVRVAPLIAALDILGI